MKILLTNDDSHDSPLFLYLINKLKSFAEVTIVVPKDEQSWTAKSNTRLRPLYMDQINLHGNLAYCLDGTPADCVNVGIYHVCSGKPDLVVSGINMGHNAGISYLLSSGTIGACLEGNIARVPAIAFSQRLGSDLFKTWNQKREFLEDELARIIAQLEKVFLTAWKSILDKDNFFQNSITWSVNFPLKLSDSWQLQESVIGKSFYNSAFKRVGDRFHLEVIDEEIDDSEGTDLFSIISGDVSITPIDISLLYKK